MHQTIQMGPHRAPGGRGFGHFDEILDHWGCSGGLVMFTLFPDFYLTVKDLSLLPMP